ncbi:polygalacturonase non-catalytic subunit AroGP2-like [Asparagus officinalis]|uniref:polygalacturonase non-catalytic subunit AroGP2-like n=1 Tax=Asparagus officinalis TaxID=4686 RepID=UPI00098E78D7|nr:polygalacturonase non-catalytic subunit AroGP2-like [Asparagus officinalis]
MWPVLYHEEMREKVRMWPVLYHEEMREKVRMWPVLYHEEMREKVRMWPVLYHEEMREKMLRKQLLADEVFAHDDTPGICFREGDLKQGNAMPFVDFRGLFPSQHFVPRSVASKMPFTSADDVKRMFHVSSATSKGMEKTVKLCNRAVTSPDEQKKCISSAEDMIDYVIQTLGSDNIEARSTESTRGCGSDILIGDLKVLNGGKFSDVVTCHQMQFPYLVHYCHSIAKTRVYEVEILDAVTKERVNHAIATCHMISMGNPEPGNIVVCHFISPWDMVWTAAAEA